MNVRTRSIRTAKGSQVVINIDGEEFRIEPGRCEGYYVPALADLKLDIENLKNTVAMWSVAVMAVISVATFVVAVLVR